MTHHVKTGVLLALALSVSAYVQGIELKGSHQEMELGCKNCHVKGMGKPAPMEACLECHGSYADLAEATNPENNDELEANPHESHLGEVDCGDCHSAHKVSEAMCHECHNFDFVTP